MLGGIQKSLLYLIVATVVLGTVFYVYLYNKQITIHRTISIDVSRSDAQINLNVFNRGRDDDVHDDGGRHDGRRGDGVFTNFVFNQQPLKKSKNIKLNQQDKSIAIGGGLRMTRCGNGTKGELDETSFFKHLIPSFCRTASPGYTYYVIFVYDEVDPCLSRPDIKANVMTYFNEIVRKTCPKGVVQDLYLRSCPYRGAPAWAQSDAMMDAYRMNITYFYR